MGLMLPLVEPELLEDLDGEAEYDALGELTMPETEADRVPLEVNEPLFVVFKLTLDRALLVPQRVALTVTVPLRDCDRDTVGDRVTVSLRDCDSDTVALPLNWLAEKLGEGV